MFDDYYSSWNIAFPNKVSLEKWIKYYSNSIENINCSGTGKSIDAFK